MTFSTFMIGLVSIGLYELFKLIVRKIRGETIIKLKNTEKMQWVIQDDITDIKNVTVQTRGHKK
jgi:hypothetical protein